MILAFGLNNMLPLPVWYGLFDHTAARACGLYRAHKMARRGLIETRNRGVGLRGGTAYSFPCFLGSLQPLSVLILAGARNVRMWLSATLLALLRDSNDRSVCLCLGRLVAAENGFQQIGRPAVNES